MADRTVLGESNKQDTVSAAAAAGENDPYTVEFPFI